MKNLLTPDIRREIKEIFERLISFGYVSDSQIAKKINIHPLTVGTWRRLEKCPSYENLDNLRNLAKGKIKIPLTRDFVESSVLGTTVSTLKPSFNPILMVKIPLMGSLPAGKPSDAIEERMGDIELPATVIGGNWNDLYVIRVMGDSAREIAYDGDLAIVRRYKQPIPGDWVIAKIDGDWTIKKWGKRSNELEPENPKYEKLVAKDELSIYGVVIKFICDPKNRRK